MGFALFINGGCYGVRGGKRPLSMFDIKKGVGPALGAANAGRSVEQADATSLFMGHDQNGRFLAGKVGFLFRLQFPGKTQARQCTRRHQ